MRVITIESVQEIVETALEKKFIDNFSISGSARIERYTALREQLNAMTEETRSQLEGIFSTCAKDATPASQFFSGSNEKLLSFTTRFLNLCQKMSTDLYTELLQMTIGKKDYVLYELSFIREHNDFDSLAKKIISFYNTQAGRQYSENPLEHGMRFRADVDMSTLSRPMLEYFLVYARVSFTGNPNTIFKENLEVIKKYKIDVGDAAIPVQRAFGFLRVWKQINPFNITPDNLKTITRLEAAWIAAVDAKADDVSQKEKALTDAIDEINQGHVSPSVTRAILKNTSDPITENQQARADDICRFLLFMSTMQVDKKRTSFNSIFANIDDLSDDFFEVFFPVDEIKQKKDFALFELRLFNPLFNLLVEKTCRDFRGATLSDIDFTSFSIDTFKTLMFNQAVFKACTFTLEQYIFIKMQYSDRNSRSMPLYENEKIMGRDYSSISLLDFDSFFEKIFYTMPNCMYPRLLDDSPLTAALSRLFPAGAMITAAQLTQAYREDWDESIPKRHLGDHSVFLPLRNANFLYAMKKTLGDPTVSCSENATQLQIYKDAYAKNPTDETLQLFISTASYAAGFLSRYGATDAMRIFLSAIHPAIKGTTAFKETLKKENAIVSVNVYDAEKKTFVLTVVRREAENLVEKQKQWVVAEKKSLSCAISNNPEEMSGIDNRLIALMKTIYISHARDNSKVESIFGSPSDSHSLATIRINMQVNKNQHLALFSSLTSASTKTLNECATLLTQYDAYRSVTQEMLPVNAKTKIH